MLFLFRIAIFIHVFVLIPGPSLIFNEVLRSVIFGQRVSFQCPRDAPGYPNFLLFTRNHSETYTTLVPGDVNSLQQSDYDPGRPTKVIIHGFIDSFFKSDWMQRMKKRFLEVDDCNVIIVDWGCGNMFPYARAIVNSNIVVKKLAELIRFLQVDENASTFHLIGHSMGSHIAARVGHSISTLGRISALDPALPRFYLMPAEERLDPSDAQFVDVIHSDAGYSVFAGLGIRTRVGHLDFYPNNGNNQPGCKDSPLSLLSRRRLRHGVGYYLTCDHYRAVEFFIESIQPPISAPSYSESQCQPVAVACQDWETFTKGKCADCSLGGCALMGYNSDYLWNNDTVNSEYYVQTFDEAPFCTFQYQVTVETEQEENGTDSGAVIENSNNNDGFIRLELEAQDGRLMRMDDKERKKLKSAEEYVYLAVSRLLIDSVERARFWFEFTTNADAENESPATNLKRIKISPLQLSTLLYNTPSSREIIMCGSNKTTIERNKQINLTINDC